MSESGQTSNIVSRRLTIHGRVQGVYYRATAQETALRLNLAGWVRNRRSGTVEAVVSGPEAAVDAFIAWAHEGPPAARVERIDIADADAPDAGSFEQRPTV
ncbi:MAG TPA: acylphosphatase [Rhodocyclaceae bacterium]|nr:acylphosphatase [Rhodocyclaceae bacterium]